MSADDVLLTGFDPFGGIARNPSGEVAAALADRWHTLVLSTSYDRSFSELHDAVVGSAVSTIVMLGLAAGVHGVRVETVGRSTVTAEPPDNDGESWFERALGPIGHLPVTLPIPTVIDSLQQSALHVETSDDAGGYVCNALLYRMLAHDWGRRMRCGFLHVGLADGGEPNDLDTYVRGVDALLTRLSTCV